MELNESVLPSLPSGTFTALERGVYCFRFTAMDNHLSNHVNMRMYKNGQQILHNSQYNRHGDNEYSSNGVNLESEEGGVVFMCIPSGRRLCDNSDSFNTLSGFLLFTVWGEHKVKVSSGNNTELLIWNMSWCFLVCRSKHSQQTPIARNKSKLFILPPKMWGCHTDL